MKKLLSMLLIGITVSAAFGQSLTLPPSGGNQKASVTQYIGPVSVTISYSSPDVHAPNGQDRTDHIWGELVPYGMNFLGFGTAKESPWRAGANENTTITFSHDVSIGGKPVKAGTYGLHLIVEKEGPWTWILSKNSSSWGSYFYEPSEDVLRVQSTPSEAPFTEYLTYGFDERKGSSASPYLQWEKKRIGFKIEVPNVNDIYIASIRDDLRGSVGFNYLNWVSAAQFCVQNKINLEEALTWADAAINPQTGGQEDFNTLSTKASVLLALNRDSEASTLMMKAVNHPSASVGQVHQYARSLINSGKPKDAMEIFKLNAKNHPEDKFTTSVGLARGYAALGDKKNAIKYWELAIKNIPDNQKQFISVYEGELNKLKKS